MTAPLTPPDCDLTSFQRMMIDIPRLRGSDFDATLDDGAWRAGLNLWLSSWHQVPAGSLSDDEATLTKAAGLGRDIRSWRKVRSEALRGWVKCEDGLLYHPVVAELALEAWLAKLAQALSSGAGNAKRWKVDFDPSTIEADIDRAATMLAALNPKSEALVKLERRKSRVVADDPDGNPGGTEKGSRRDTENIPSGSQGKGTGKGIEERRPPNPPIGGPSEKLNAALKAFPLDGTGTCPPRKSEAAWWRAVAIAGSEVRLLAAVLAFVASGFTGKPRRFDRWLDDGSFEAFVPGADVDRPGWTGPSEIRAAFAELGEPWCVSWIDRCTWRDLPEASIVAPNAYHLKRMTDDAGAIIANLGIPLTLDTERTAA